MSRSPDPFVATSNITVDSDILKSTLSSFPSGLAKEAFGDFTFADPLDKGSTQPIGGTRLHSFKLAWRKNFFTNVSMAAVGGVFLIGPMWLMVLHNTPLTALTTTTACVFVFGIIMAWNLENTMSVLSLTAAYSAVLVVFVGTTSAPSIQAQA